MSSSMEISFSFYIFLSAGICALVVMLLCLFLKPKKFAAGRAIAAAVCGVVLIGAGITISVLHADKEEYTYQTRIFTASYSSVSLSCLSADVVVTQGDGDSLTLTMPQTDDFSVEEDGDELFVTQKSNFPFGRIFLQTKTVTLTLPASGIEGLTILTDAGDVTITGGTAVFLSVSTDAGDISIASFAADALHASTDAGDIAVENTTVSALLRAEADAGNITLSSVTAATAEAGADTGNIKLTDVAGEQIEVTTDAGDILLSSVTAASITAATDVGDIELDYAEADAFYLTTDIGSIGGVIRGAESEYTVSVKHGFGNGNIAEKTVTTDRTLILEVGVGEIDIYFNLE